MKQHYPFSAIVGQDEFKLALALCLVDPGIGGVLAMGDKGTGKTTTVRALSCLMGPNTLFPFINLPIGATEERVLGSIRLETLLHQQKIEIEKGLLNKADKGILYVDEVNLLDDYLMDALLDAAAMDGYYLERDNVSQWMPSSFILVGTMNPEEGKLRPQLLDRFGLSVHIETPSEPELRKKIVKNRLAFDADPISFVQKFQQKEESLRQLIAQARKNLQEIEVSEAVYDSIAQICAEKNIEGLRADILLVKTARAFAAYHLRKKVTQQDIVSIQSLVLRHRLNENREKNNRNPESNGENSEKKNPRILQNPLNILKVN